MTSTRTWTATLLVVSSVCNAGFSATPSNEEQLWLEMVNRFRANPTAELDLLANYTEPNGNTFASPASDDVFVDGALRAFSVDAAVLRQQFNALTAAPPLAWSEALNDSATYYSGVMSYADRQSHTLDGLTLRQRIEQNSSYDFTGSWSIGENIFGFTQNVFQGHAGFVIDWGNTPTGIQNPPGHRDSLINPSFREIGIAMEPAMDTAVNLGPFVVTQHLAFDSPDGPFLTGVAYHDDVIDDDFYSVGEGIDGLMIEVFEAGSTNLVTSMMTWPSGGYTVELDANVYDVRFTSDEISETFLDVDLTSGQNVKLDLINPSSVMMVPGDANGDGQVDAADLNILAINWQKMVTGGPAEGDFNASGTVDAADLNELALNWQFGVPTDEMSLSFDFSQALSAAHGDHRSTIVIPQPATWVMLTPMLAIWRRRQSQ